MNRLLFEVCGLMATGWYRRLTRLGFVEAHEPVMIYWMSERASEILYEREMRRLFIIVPRHVSPGTLITATA